MNQKLFYWDETELWKVGAFSVSSLYILCIKCIVQEGSEAPVIKTLSWQINQKDAIVWLRAMFWLFKLTLILESLANPLEQRGPQQRKSPYLGL